MVPCPPRIPACQVPAIGAPSPPLAANLQAEARPTHPPTPMPWAPPTTRPRPPGAVADDLPFYLSDLGPASPSLTSISRPPRSTRNLRSRSSCNSTPSPTAGPRHRRRTWSSPSSPACVPVPSPSCAAPPRARRRRRCRSREGRRCGGRRAVAPGRRAVAPSGGRPLPEARRGHAHAGRGAGGDHVPEELRLPRRRLPPRRLHRTCTAPPTPARTSRASSTAPSTPTSSWTPTPRPNYFMIRTDFPSRDPCVLPPSARPFGHSSNTEGMHLQNTRDVEIKSSSVGCGDDCVSIETGCATVQIKS